MNENNANILPLTEPPTEPAGPMQVTMTSDDSCELRWLPPHSNGGTPITSYILELRETTSNIWRRIGSVEATTTSFQLRSLQHDNEYYVRVIARNQEGESFPLMSDIIAPKKRIGKSRVSCFSMMF